ncbi:hypothetical protein VTK73DRAFT_9139 [Phialemonium thermophilum]|uniref:HpcH/HpaI aldolase/citrate lyase domain-containing protein n=1 Tax=Phialemonium thermophilum TaxID=223376 RepID=A0ABR3XMX0_9PEZI
MTDRPWLEQPELHVKAEHRAAQLTNPANLREALRQAQKDPKKVLLGPGQGIPSVFVTKLLASTKPDFVWIDAEHGVFSRSELYDAVQAVQHHSEGKSLAIVRVPKLDEVMLVTALDAGAAGIILPQCETAEEVRKKIKESYYPPLGHRSFSPWIFTPGVSDVSMYSDDPFNIKTANNHVAFFAQVESLKGMENLEEIAAVEGLSGLMFGPGDYSLDAQIEIKLGGPPNPRLLAAMEKFATIGRKYNLPLLGNSSAGTDMIPIMAKQGYCAICYLLDVWSLTQMTSDTLKKARKALEEADFKQDGSDGKAN